MKKGSLNLSINAIVVLILAITMLGLGLGFIKTMFGGAVGQLADINDEIKNDMISELKSSGERLTLKIEDTEIKSSSTEDYMFGVYNVEALTTEEETAGGKTFYIDSGCTKTMSNGDSTITTESFATTIPLDQNEADIVKLLIKVPASAEKTTHRCNLKIYRQDPETLTDTAKAAALYAQKNFFVTVK